MPRVEGYLEEKATLGPGGPTHPIAPGGTYPPIWGPEAPVDPGYGVPLPPVTVWPNPPGGEHPSHPIQPTYPVDPDYGLPVAPGVWPQPPVGIWPPPAPVLPTHPIYPGGGPAHPMPPYPDQGLPEGEHPIAPGGGPAHPIALPPGSVWPPLPPSITGTILCFVWIVGVGYRWTVIDPSLTPGHDLPGSQPHPDQGLPAEPAPQPHARSRR